MSTRLSCPHKYLIKCLKTVVTYHIWFSLAPILICKQCGAILEPPWDALGGEATPVVNLGTSISRRLVREKELYKDRIPVNFGMRIAGAVAHQPDDTLEPSERSFY